MVVQKSVQPEYGAHSTIRYPVGFYANDDLMPLQLVSLMLSNSRSRLVQMLMSADPALILPLWSVIQITVTHADQTFTCTTAS